MEKILIVEDNPIVAEDIKIRLRQMGYEVTAVALSGEEALEAADANLPDISLMDIQLGDGMNGIDAAAELKRKHELPVIYLTAYADEGTVVRAKKTEPYGYVVKPFDDEELKSVIEIALYKQKLDRQLRESQKWLRTTMKSIGDAVIATDAKGQVTFMNPVAECLTGWSEDEAAGKPVVDVFKIINENTRETLENPVARVLEEGGIVGLANHTLLVDRGGREIPIADSGSPIKDADGQIIGVVLVFRDQTEERKAQEVLENSRKRLVDAQRIAKMGDFIWNVESGEVSWSEALFELLGYEKSETIDYEKVDAEIHHPEDRERVYNWLNDSISSGSNQLEPNEYRVLRKGGEIVHVRTTGMVKREEGKSPEIFGTVVDVTARKRAEAALLREKQKAEQYLDIAGVMFIGLDKTGKVFLANRKACQVLECSQNEILGCDWFEEFVPHDNRNDVFSIFEQLMAGDAESVEYFENSVVSRKGNGKLIAWHNTFVRAEDGEIVGILCSGEDITALRRTQDALAHQEEIFKAIVDNIPAMITLYDPSARVFLANKAFESAVGWKNEDYKHVDIMEVCYPDPRYRAGVYEYMKNASNEWREFRVKTKYGHYIDSIWSNVRLEDGTQIGIGIDITEKKLLEANLRQAQKMEAIGNLAGGIAHDFNNILSSVLGYTELALGEIEKGTGLEDSLMEVYAAGKRARDLVKQILAFARRSDEEIRPIQPSTIAKEVLKLIRSSIPATIEIKKSLKSDSLIMGNAIQVHQVLMNLCTNAAQAMEDSGGALKVTSKDVFLDNEPEAKSLALKPCNYIEIKVSDTGSGIPSEILGRIFDPYFTTKSPGEGTGMGLAMVLGIVESYGGKIVVDSRLRKGTTFTIYLPVAGKPRVHRFYEPEVFPSGTERILFVDDEIPIAKVGGRILENIGYSVVTKTDSLEALELFRSQPGNFDLVVTDMTMPKMTGDKLAEELLKIRADIPIILCTGYSKNLSDEKAAEIGIKAIANKPIIKADLAKIIRNVLDDAANGLR